MKGFLSALLLLAAFNSQLFAGGSSQQTELETGMNGRLSLIGRYSTGSVNSDGGIAEIVVYNKDNRRIYLVNGALGSLDIVNAGDLRSGRFTEMSLYRRIDVSALGSMHGFVYGDLTSVAISTRNKLVALAVQHPEYNMPGYIVLVDYEGNYLRHYQAGVQPDMITFTPDEQFVLTADEGEPRQGYDGNAIDPPGSVTILNVASGEVSVVGFENFDAAQARAALVQNGVILNTGTRPSLDFEPEYIAVSEDNRTAWVALQEANAIAVLDIPGRRFTSVLGLGFKDHSLPQNSLDALRDGRIELANHDLLGVYMPDGIAAVTIRGTNYVLTANEGDAREWNNYDDIAEIRIDNNRIDIINVSLKEGLNANRNYLYGARSFSIWDMSAVTSGSGLASLVYDSGNDFERITAELFPENFNASHTNNELDSRSGRKGPEPEYISILRAGNRIYAVIGLERIGGIMVYDISNPQAPVFYDYINTRDFSQSALEEMGDLGPEGLYAVEARDSPTRHSLIFVANEVSGTISAYEMR